MKRDKVIGMVLAATALNPGLSIATESSYSTGENWQTRMLFTPSEEQLAIERKGRVMIYDGMRSTDVEKALDETFDRIDSMMFVNTVVTDTEGAPVHDPETGQLVIEEDGCD
jgi:hypothetical protein